MQMELHNKLNNNHQKTMSTVEYFTHSKLDKFDQRGKWKLEVWLDKVKSDKKVSCAMALIRPQRSTIFVRRRADSSRDAIKKSINSIAKSARRATS